MRCMKSLAKYAERCDFLARPYELKTKNNQFNLTLIGGVTSLMLIILAILYFITTFSKFLKEE
jgi:hypothetical protein